MRKMTAYLRQRLLISDSFSKYLKIFVVSMLLLPVSVSFARQFSTYRSVSDHRDDGFAWSETEQDINSPFLVIGDNQSYLAPFHMSAMRFIDVNIPRGARIVDARLRISSLSEGIRGQIYGTVGAEAIGNALDFSQRYFAQAARAGASVRWDHKINWSANTWYESPDISTVVQEIVDRIDWSEGNAMALFYSTAVESGKSRMFASFEANPNSAPILKVDYEVYSISGYISKPDGTSLAGVRIHADEHIEDVITDANGFYSIRVTYDWSGEISVSRSKWGFEPASRYYSDVTSDFVSQDYEAKRPTISGYVADVNGNPIEEVYVRADHGNLGGQTDPNGFYQVEVYYGWTGVLEAQKQDWLNWEFQPGRKTFIEVTESVINEDFIGQSWHLYGGGRGTPEYPYIIENAQQLNSIGANQQEWDKHFILAADIDCSGISPTEFNIIGKYFGSYGVTNYPFIGTFDGAGHVISGLSIRKTDGTVGVGLFGYLWSDARIRHLTLEAPQVVSLSARVGAIAGICDNSTIIDCHVNGGTIIGAGQVGGVVGLQNYGRLWKCSSRAEVFSEGDSVGGLIGFVHYGNIFHCMADAVTNGNNNVGGLIGYIENTHSWYLTRENYAIGSVTGNTAVGGFAGYAKDTQLIDCYSAASVTGIENVGGLIGFADNLYSYYDSNCFWDTTVNPLLSGVGNIQGDASWILGRETSELQIEETYVNAGWNMGYSAADVWCIPMGGGYPCFWWEMRIDPGQALGNGSGTVDDPYIISTVDELNAIGRNPELMNYCYRLESDIDLTGIKFNSIADTVFPFTGVFDGNDHTIYGLDTSASGLITYIVGSEAMVKNLTLQSVKVGTPDSHATGALASSLTDGTIENCKVFDVNVVGDSDVGGLVGNNTRGNIINCLATGYVTSDSDAGGLVGANGAGNIERCSSTSQVIGRYSGCLVGVNGGTITDCNSSGYATGNCTGGLAGVMNGYIFRSWSDAGVEVSNSFTDGSAGGLAGELRGNIHYCYSLGTVRVNTTTNYGSAGGLAGKITNNGRIHNSYSLADVIGGKYSGGIAGYLYSGGIVDSYSASMVSGDQFVGGIVGDSYYGPAKVEDCVWDVNVSGITTSDGGIPKTTIEMYDPNTYLGIGWDFYGELDNGSADEWIAVDANSYPVFSWQLETPPALPEFSGGTGEPNNPYLIATLDDLSRIGDNRRLLDKHFLVINDINVAGAIFPKIGAGHYPFSGTFDGGGYTIANTKQSIFQSVRGETATIMDLGLIQPEVNEADSSLLVQVLEDATISRCWVEGGWLRGNWNLGSLVSQNTGGRIFDSFVDCSVTSQSGYYIGGLVGRNYQGRIHRCFSIGKVTGGEYVGGLVGYSNGVVGNCYSHADVNGVKMYGGLAGLTSNTILSSYSTGQVSPGGAGLANAPLERVFYCFWDRDTSGISTGGVGVACSTAEMMREDTFIGWGDQYVWTIDEGLDYPRLFWQKQPGQTITTGTGLEGKGTKEDPYVIASLRDLDELLLNPETLDKHWLLTSDLDLPMSPDNVCIITNFSGVFDGGGHRITNLVIDSDDASNVGFFGTLAESAVVRNLIIEGVDITASNCSNVGTLSGLLAAGASIENVTIANVNMYTDNCEMVGGVVGRTEEGSWVENVIVSEITTDANQSTWIAGLVGYCLSNVSHCIVDCDISGDSTQVGGLAGRAEGTVSSCSVTCTLQGGQYVGGLIAFNLADVNDCNVICDANGSIDVGGLLGYSSGHLVSDCLIQSLVRGESGIGGAVGYCYGTQFENCIARSDVSGESSVGCFAGSTKATKFRQCSARGNASGNDYIGGFIGGFWFARGNETEVFQCWADCTAVGENYVGGFIGYSGATVSECYSGSNVSGLSQVGGLVGRIYEEGTITNCYAYGNVDANNNVGGLVGYNTSAPAVKANVINCYVVGVVTGNDNVGGLVGFPDSTRVRYSYWDTETTGQDTSAGGEGKTTADMMQISTFDEWACREVWTIDEGFDYPRLAWENKTGVLISTDGWFAGGDGEPDAPYLIETAQQLNKIGEVDCLWDGHFKMIADIDLADYDGQSGRPAFNMIGRDGCEFSGSFDGNDHVILNLTIISPNGNYVGLFRYAKNYLSDTFIKDLGFFNPIIKAGSSDYVGVLAGICYGTDVNNCRAQSTLVIGHEIVGGLVGSAELENCYADGTVSGNSVVGGLVGNGNLTNCRFDGSVTGTGSNVGGLIGSGSVSGCLASIQVTGYGNVGGLIGILDTHFDPQILDSNCSGRVTGTGGDGVGGIIGTCGHYEIINCHSTCTVQSNGDYVGGLVGQGGDRATQTSKFTDCSASGTVNGHWFVGGLVGAGDCFIERCHSHGSVTGWSDVGGLIGSAEGNIIDCYSTANVNGLSAVGGLIGYNNRNVIRCYATGNVSASGDYIGGLIGRNSSNNCSISNCYAKGSVSVYPDSDFVGGLVGFNEDGSTISTCYSTGYVNRTDTTIGGLVGQNDGVVSNSFWDIQTSGQSTSDGGTGKTSAEMRTASTFLGWGCESLWTIAEGSNTPMLAYQKAPGNILPYEPPWQGSGTEETPYLISDAQELQMIAFATCEQDKHFTLVTDVNLSSYDGLEGRPPYTPIGNLAAPFKGVFEGGGHRITGFRFSADDTEYCGVFGCIINPAVVRNCIIEDVNITLGVGQYVGALVGKMLSNSKVAQCGCRSISIKGGNYCGGLVGMNDEGEIGSCYSNSSITGGNWLGGLVGLNDGTIRNSYAEGGTVGADNIGGLVGENYYWDGYIYHCYSTAHVEGSSPFSDAGGLIGKGSGFVYDSYWDIQTSGQSSSAGGTGVTSQEMRDINTYFAWLCDSVWTIENGVDTPRLAWEGDNGVLIDIGIMFAGGRGEPDDPYLIETAGQLNTINLFDCGMDKYYRLIADINLADLEETPYNMIGDDEYFSGVFDGAGHVVSNLRISESVSRSGLFACVAGNNAQVMNIGIINPQIEVMNKVGVAPLIGNLFYGEVLNCWSFGGSVAGNSDVGGLVGRCYNAAIYNSYSEGVDVYGYLDTGGLIGENYGEVEIQNCYSDCNVAGNSVVGGLVGKHLDGTVRNCYSVSTVSSAGVAGGLVATGSGEIEASFYDKDVCGQLDGTGGLGLSTELMQTPETFLQAGWDFINEINNGEKDVWRLCNIGYEYPQLNWQYAKGDFVCPDGVDLVDLEKLCEQWLLEEIPLKIYDNDEIINFFEWSMFAAAWQSTPTSPNWNPHCDIAPTGGDGKVDIEDMILFCKSWLKVGVYYLNADIAPLYGDSIVNMLDFAFLARDWLQRTK